LVGSGNPNQKSTDDWHIMTLPTACKNEVEYKYQFVGER